MREHGGNGKRKSTVGSRGGGGGWQSRHDRGTEQQCHVSPFHIHTSGGN